MNHPGNKEVVLFVGVDPDMREEVVATGRQPVTTDKSEATQRPLVGREIMADFHGKGDDDVGKFTRKVWRNCLRSRWDSSKVRFGQIIYIP